MRYSLPVLIGSVLLFAAVPLEARNELTAGYSVPEFASMPSSAWADGVFGVFLNPANLYRIDRINTEFATGQTLGLSLFGVSSVVAHVGGVSAGLVHFDSVEGVLKQGVYLAWGREVLGSLAVGASLKNFGSNLFDFGDTVLFDLAATFHPNETLAPFFGRDFVRERLFLSLAVQNLGRHGTYETDEDAVIRLGLGYDVRELDTKIFLDKCFLGENPRFAFGAEIAPRPLRFVSFRIAYDLNGILAGVSLEGRDVRAHLDYDAENGAYFVGVEGSFEQTRSEIADHLDDAAGDRYDEAVSLYKLPDDAGKLDSFRAMNSALGKYRLALFYDDANTNASRGARIVESALQDARAENVRLGEESLSRRSYPSALVYFQRAAAIRRDRSLRLRIASLLTNAAVVSYISDRASAVDQLIGAGKLLDAKQKVVQILWVSPGYGWAQRKSREIDRRLQAMAENLYRTAQAQYDRKDYPDCIANLQKALTYRADYPAARRLLSQANADYANIALLAGARSSYQAGNYLAALAAVNKLLGSGQRSDEAKQLKDKIVAALRANLNTYLANGIEFYNNKDYEKAIAEFDKVLAVDPYNGVATDYRNKAVAKLDAIRRYQNTAD